MKYFAVVAILLVLIGGGVYLLNSSDDRVTETATSTSESSEENTNSTTQSGMRAEENAVIVVEQKPGRKVTIAQVHLASSGYVVIHESEGGNPGPIIGSSRLFSAGEHSKVEIELIKDINVGDMLFAMLHNENNENTSFEASADVPVQSRLGGPIMGSFEVSATANPDVKVIL